MDNIYVYNQFGLSVKDFAFYELENIMIKVDHIVKGKLNKKFLLLPTQSVLIRISFLGFFLIQHTVGEGEDSDETFFIVKSF